jgi:hypothetical protein
MEQVCSVDRHLFLDQLRLQKQDRLANRPRIGTLIQQSLSPRKRIAPLPLGQHYPEKKARPKPGLYQLCTEN